MKTYVGVVVWLHSFLTSALDEDGQSSIGERPRYPFDRRLRSLQNRSGRGDKEQKFPSVSLACIEPRSPARSLVTILFSCPIGSIIHEMRLSPKIFGRFSSK